VRRVQQRLPSAACARACCDSSARRSTHTPAAHAAERVRTAGTL
jgi:hypothetical protein